MHYHAEVVLRPGQELAAIMAPHEEVYDENTDTLSGIWDWYQIGGRWTGVKSSQYDPEKDPANIERCGICGGTGYRNDAIGQDARRQETSYTCNGCGAIKDGKWTHGEHGKGYSLKWPTSWKTYAGDICAAAHVPQDLTCFTLIVDDQVYMQQRWNGETFEETEFDGNVAKKLRQLGIDDALVVTVDYHC